MKKLEHDPYKVLGVDKNATEEQIKQAYRQRASQSHPDKGGSHEEQIRVNAAYEVLKNKVTRLLYDQTGFSETRTLEQETVQQLTNEFAKALDADTLEPTKFVRNSLKSQKYQIQRNRTATLEAKKKWERKRGRVKIKEKKRKEITNFYELIIDKQLTTIEAGLALLDRQEKLCDACLEMLDAYEDAPLPKHTYNIDLDKILPATGTTYGNIFFKREE